MLIKSYIPEYENAVIDLWERCGLTVTWNNPKLDIERKMKVDPELLLVGLLDGRIIASAMGGYESHRGWVNYLAIDPEYREKGLGRQMMDAIEAKLRERGCPKINLQIRSSNSEALAFYDKIGYKADDVVSMGKRLVED
ncbi:MAG: GNAT family acetyltransferase [Dehalococcoidales bacterium]|nr:GNAT family acetyltransferase [Dehalococcoidales bacterium]